jgi:hypothetical protein
MTGTHSEFSVSCNVQKTLIPNPSQQQWAQVLLIECWIEGLATGVSVTVWSWLKYYIFEDKIPYFWQCVIPAIVHATWSNIFTILFKMVASRKVGIFKAPHVTGWKKFYYYTADVIMGTISIGGALAIGKKIFQDPDAHMGFVLELIIFVFSFFTYYLLKLWTNMAILGMEYEIETSTYVDRNDQPLLKLFMIEFLFMELLTLETLLTNYIHIVISFSIYPPLADLITDIWVDELFHIPGLVEIVLLFWFFAEYEACDALCAFFFKKAFHYPKEEQEVEREDYMEAEVAIPDGSDITDKQENLTSDTNHTQTSSASSTTMNGSKMGYISQQLDQITVRVNKNSDNNSEASLETVYQIG